jgi:hypothetical protein
MERVKYDWIRRAVRTGLQLIASGALFALTEQLAKDVPAEYTPYVLGGYTLLVAGVQNFLEDNVAGMPAILKGKPSAGQNPVPDAPAPRPVYREGDMNAANWPNPR